MIKTVLLKKPTVSFYLLTFLITWVIWLPLVVYYFSSPFEVSFTAVPIYLILLAFIGFFGPTFAGLIMAHLENGSSGVKALLSKWTKFRVPVKWYLFILLSQVFIDFISTQIAIHAFTLDVNIDMTKWSGFIPALIRTALIGGAIAEETGWRGYLLSKELNRTNALPAGIKIGVVWAFWHLPICLIPGANFPVPLSLNVFVVFLLNVVFISIIITTLYQNSNGSVFIGYLYHILLNVSLLSSIYRFADTEVSWWIKICISTAFHGVIAATFIFIFGYKSLKKQLKH